MKRLDTVMLAVGGLIVGMMFGHYYTRYIGPDECLERCRETIIKLEEAYEPMVLLIDDGSAMMFIEDEWVRMCRCPEEVPE